MNKKRGLILILFIIISMNLIIISSQISNEKVSEDIYEELEKNKTINVIVELKDNSNQTINILNDSNIAENEKYKNYVITEVSLDEVEKLKSNTKVKKINENKQISAFLQDSVHLVNASETWKLQSFQINLTGTGQTVCIIDTGTNFLHSDLIGKNKSCVIDCYNKACVENCSIGDDNGHGTHVAGIIAASGGLFGVAINVSLISVKVLNSAGDGSASATLDLTRSIDYCVSKNVSVITMSLGTRCIDGNCFNTDCSEQSSPWTESIAAAVAKNISVVAATGNEYNTSGISSPACISNVTAVGATTKTDGIASYSNRNSLVSIFAPGGTSGELGSCSIAVRDPNRICSTYSNGNYVSMSGTSMATPHVAAAIAIINQFLNLTSRTRTPGQIKSILNLTGKIIYDSGTGINFSRINVYNAIVSLDNLAPNVSLISPPNNQANSSLNQTFRCNASDNLGITNITLKIWSSNNLYYNYTESKIGNFAESIFNVSLQIGTYQWNCLANDLSGNSSYAIQNYSLIVGNMSVSLITPEDNHYRNINQTNFSCSSETISTLKLTNNTFYLWNLTNLIYNSTLDVSGLTNLTIFSYNFSLEGNYSWNCKSYNNISEFAFASSNKSIVFDKTNPVIDSISSSVTTTSATISYNINEAVNSTLIYGTTTLNNNILNASYLTNFSTSISDLSSSTTYYYNISVCDRSGNCISNGTFSITTSAQQITSSGNTGGGGGGGAAYMTYTITDKEGRGGYVQNLSKNDRIKFTFYDLKSNEHLLIINEVKEKFANITVMSSPINLILGIGQSVKLNLSSSEYYDTYIKIDDINNDKVKVTIQLINEKIIMGERKIVAFNETNENKSIEETPKTNVDIYSIKYLDEKLKIYFYLVLIIFIMAIVIIFIKRRKLKQEQIKKEYKDLFKKNIKPREFKPRKKKNEIIKTFT